MHLTHTYLFQVIDISRQLGSLFILMMKRKKFFHLINPQNYSGYFFFMSFSPMRAQTAECFYIVFGKCLLNEQGFFYCPQNSGYLGPWISKNFIKAMDQSRMSPLPLHKHSKMKQQLTPSPCSNYLHICICAKCIILERFLPFCDLCRCPRL